MKNDLSLCLEHYYNNKTKHTFVHAYPGEKVASHLDHLMTFFKANQIFITRKSGAPRFFRASDLKRELCKNKDLTLGDLLKNADKEAQRIKNIFQKSYENSLCGQVRL